MLLMAWTTLPTREDAERLADAAVVAGLAVCVQIEGPITSVYRWDSKLQHSQEFRLAFKYFRSQALALESKILDLHPLHDTRVDRVRSQPCVRKILVMGPDKPSSLTL